MADQEKRTLGIFPRKISVAKTKDTGMAMALLSLLAGCFSGNQKYFYIAILFLIIAMLLPAVFKPVSKVLLGTIHLLGLILSKFVLILIYFLIVTPIGFLRRIMGQDSLKLRQWKKDDPSVFKVREYIFQASDIEEPC